MYQEHDCDVLVGSKTFTQQAYSFAIQLHNESVKQDIHTFITRVKQDIHTFIPLTANTSLSLCY